jgi:putative MATE family efflux protein
MAQTENLESDPRARAWDWGLLREAVRGSQRDLTTESLGRAILLLAIPMVAEMMMESVFVVADVFWVAKLGADALASVGLAESLVVVIEATAMGLSMGATAVVARRIGAKDPAGAARAAVQAMALALVLAALAGVAGALAAPRLLGAMGASPGVVAVGTSYTRVLLGGSGTLVMLFVVNAIFRGAGDPAIAMRTLWLANGINIVLGPCLVFGWGPFPRLGVTGAAVATTIGRGAGVLYLVRALVRGRGHLTVGRAEVRLDRKELGTIVRLSSSGVVQSLIGMTSWLGLLRILSRFGSATLGGHTIAIRIVLFALLPSWGLGGAAATLVGQNLGAGRPERAEQAVWRAAFYNAVFLGVVGLALAVLSTPIVGLFSSEPAVVELGARSLRVVSVGFVFYAYGMVATQALNGAGDTRTPTLINLACYWLGEVPAAYLLANPMGLGPTGVWVSITLAFSAHAVVAVLVFRRGRWKAVKV